MPALACLTALVALVGVRGTGALSAACVCLALPGFALFGRPTSTLGAVLRALSGLALSSGGIVLSGAIGLRFGPGAWLASPLLLSAFGRALRLGLGPRARETARVAEAFERHPRDALAFACVFGFALLLTLPALLGVGRSIDSAHRYNAFFCADLFKHAAYTASLASGPLPPVDPFSVGDSLHYYWLSYVLPAAALQIGGAKLRSIDLLLGQTLLHTFALASLLYGLARRLGPGPRAAAAATLLGLASPSLDGLAALLSNPRLALRALVEGSNLESLDLTRLFGAPDHFAASTLYRLCLYVPQHQLAVLLLLGWGHLAFRPDAHGAVVRSARLSIVAVLPLVSLLVAPPALLAILLVRLGVWFGERSASAGRARQELLAEAMAVGAGCGLVLVGGALGAPGDVRAALDLLRDDAGGAEHLLWLAPQLVTSFGGMLVLGVLGAWRGLKNPLRSGLARALSVAVLAAGLGSLVLAEWLLPSSDLRMNVELKASFVIWIALVLGSALLFHEWRRPSRLAHGSFAVAALLFLAGAPSIVHDVLWHSTSPRDRALTQRWHIDVPDDDMAAFDWAREHVPDGARFVQQPIPSFLEGGVDTWVPVFAGRPVVAAPRAGVRRELRLERARGFFRAPDVREASRLAHELGAEFVYLSAALDPLEYERIARLLGSDPRAFRRVYAAPRASIWRVM